MSVWYAARRVVLGVMSEERNAGREGVEGGKTVVGWERG